MEGTDLKLHRIDNGNIDIYEKRSDSIPKNDHPASSEKPSFFSLFKKKSAPKLHKKKNAYLPNKMHRSFQIISPSLNIQQRRYKIFSSKNKQPSNAAGNQKEDMSQTINLNLPKDYFGYTSSALKHVEEKGFQVNGDSHSNDIRFVSTQKVITYLLLSLLI